MSAGATGLPGAVFAGAALGGMLAGVLPNQVQVFGTTLAWEHALYGLFALSTLCRILIATAFLRRINEMRVTRRAGIGEVVLRVARFNSISGVVFDLVAATRKRRRRAWFDRAKPST